MTVEQRHGLRGSQRSPARIETIASFELALIFAVYVGSVCLGLHAWLLI